MRLDKRWVNTSTGEVAKESSVEFPPHFDEERGCLFWNRKQFAKTFADVPFPAAMTLEDIGRMTLLSKRVYSQTNTLGYRGNGGVRPYSFEQVGEIIKCGPRQARRFFDRMTRFGLMAKVRVLVGESEETQWYLNPIYFFSNNRLPLNLYLIFRTHLNAVLPQWVIQRFGEQEAEHA